MTLKNRRQYRTTIPIRKDQTTWKISTKISGNCWMLAKDQNFTWMSLFKSLIRWNCILDWTQIIQNYWEKSRTIVENQRTDFKKKMSNYLKFILPLSLQNRPQIFDPIGKFKIFHCLNLPEKPQRYSCSFLNEEFEKETRYM